MKEQKMR